MASQDINQFFELLAQDPDLQEELFNAETEEEGIKHAVSAAQARGYSLSADEIRTWIATAEEEHEGTLSEEDLEAVAGASWTSWSKSCGGSWSTFCSGASGCG